MRARARISEGVSRQMRTMILGVFVLFGAAISACSGSNTSGASGSTESALSTRATAAGSGSAASAGSAHADKRPHGGKDCKHGPPPEAKAACVGLYDGEDCTVTLGGEMLAGTCRAGH